MNASEAFAAYEHAAETISGCESINDLDTASDMGTAFEDCPDHFTQEQKALAQMIILHAFEKGIGRA